MSALEEEDFIGDSSGYGGGKAALAGRDSGEAVNVGPAGRQDATECVAEHLAGEGVIGGKAVHQGPLRRREKRGGQWGQ